MDDLATLLAQAPRDLDLHGYGLEDAPEQVVGRLAVIEGLVTRGLLDGLAGIKCWASPRSSLS